MIGRIRGQLVHKQAPLILVEVGGVGYELQVPMTTLFQLPELGSEVSLVTHFVVREDAQLLYGFIEEGDRSLFRELIKVSGVGPRIALAILSGVTVDEFHRCVEAQDHASLVRVPGIGRKIAERLVIEMRDRLKILAGPAFVAGSGGAAVVASNPQTEAFSALVSLGYKPAEVSRLLQKVDPAVTSTEELIRHALRAAAS